MGYSTSFKVYMYVNFQKYLSIQAPLWIGCKIQEEFETSATRIYFIFLSYIKVDLGRNMVWKFESHFLKVSRMMGNKFWDCVRGRDNFHRYTNGGWMDDIVPTITLIYTLWPYLTFIVSTDHSVLAVWQQYRPIVTVWLHPNGPKCRCNVRVSPARLR